MIYGAVFSFALFSPDFFSYFTWGDAPFSFTYFNCDVNPTNVGTSRIVGASCTAARVPRPECWSGRLSSMRQHLGRRAGGGGLDAHQKG